MDKTLVALLMALSASHANLAQHYADLAQHHSDPDLDTLTLARAIQGEEAGQFGTRRQELGEWIAHTAYNRWQKPWWKTIDDVDCTFAARIEYDWHGTKRIQDPDPWAVEIAARVLTERDAGLSDPTGGALFAMTLEDLQNTRRLEGAVEVKLHVVPSAGKAQFWFMSDYPEQKGNPDADHY